MSETLVVIPHLLERVAHYTLRVIASTAFVAGVVDLSYVNPQDYPLAYLKRGTRLV